MAAKRASSEAKSRAEKPLLHDRLIDEALEATFPASDPPFFVGAGAEPSLQPEAEADARVADKGRRPAKQDKR